jgi:hypothetical protein
MAEDEKRTQIRLLLQHEDLLRDQRMGWFLALNGFLFASLSFAWKASSGLSLVIAGVGIAVAVSSFATLRISGIARGKLQGFVGPDGDDAPVVAITGEDLKKLSGIEKFYPKVYMWNVIPIVLIAAWFGVVIVRTVSW